MIQLQKYFSQYLIKQLGDHVTYNDIISLFLGYENKVKFRRNFTTCLNLLCDASHLDDKLSTIIRHISQMQKLKTREVLSSVHLF